MKINVEIESEELAGLLKILDSQQEHKHEEKAAFAQHLTEVIVSVTQAICAYKDGGHPGVTSTLYHGQEAKKVNEDSPNHE